MKTNKRQSSECCPPSGGSKAHDSGIDCKLHRLVRPRFYAGQLLKSEDLASLVGWSRDKFALQRYKHGWGAVCGLDVKLHPDDPASIEVSPGSAVDYCGNDLISVCPETIDLKSICYQCLDPCAPEDKKGGVPCPPPCDARGLVAIDIAIEYEEQPDKPMAVAQDPCCGGVEQSPRCEFSRICEGVRLVAKCGDPNCTMPDGGYKPWHDKVKLLWDKSRRIGRLSDQKLFDELEDDPPAYLGYLRKCYCDEGFRARELRRHLVLDRHIAFHALHRQCDPEHCETGIPLARVWMKCVPRGECCIVEIDNHPPHRRHFGPRRPPAPFGKVNLSPWFWSRLDNLCGLVKEVGATIEASTRVEWDYWEKVMQYGSAALGEVDWLADCESKLGVVWGDFGICGCRVVAFKELNQGERLLVCPGCPEREQPEDPCKPCDPGIPKEPDPCEPEKRPAPKLERGQPAYGEPTLADGYLEVLQSMKEGIGRLLHEAGSKWRTRTCEPCKEDPPPRQPPPPEDPPPRQPPPPEDPPPPREDPPPRQPPVEDPPPRIPPVEEQPPRIPPVEEQPPRIPPVEEQPPRIPPVEEQPPRIPPVEEQPPVKIPPVEEQPPVRIPPVEEQPPVRIPPVEEQPPLREEPRSEDELEVTDIPTIVRRRLFPLRLEADPRLFDLTRVEALPPEVIPVLNEFGILSLEQFEHDDDPEHREEILKVLRSRAENLEDGEVKEQIMSLGRGTLRSVISSAKKELALIRKERARESAS